MMKRLLSVLLVFLLSSVSFGQSVRLKTTSEFNAAATAMHCFTGVVVAADDKGSTILTCAHAILGSQGDIEVYIPQQCHGTYCTPERWAKCVVLKEYLRDELVLLRTSEKLRVSYPLIPADEKIQLGGEVQARGYPAGSLIEHVSVGTIDSITKNRIYVMVPVKRGMSGGPILYRGKVIGITIGHFSDRKDNIAYGVSADEIRRRFDWKK